MQVTHEGKLQPVPVDDVRLCFAGKELEQLWFTSGPFTLQPGWNDVPVQCYVSEERVCSLADQSHMLLQMPVSGMFRLELSRLLCGNLCFDYDPRLSAASNSSKQPVPYLYIPENARAFGATLEIPERGKHEPR